MQFHVIIQLAALILLIQSSPDTTSKSGERAPPPLCSVSGRVVTTAEGAPLKRSRVALIPEHERRAQEEVYAVESDSDGRFTIKDVLAGRYKFVATHTGYVDQEYHSAGGESGAILGLHPGEEIKDVLFRMTPAAVIRGRVTDEDDDPMALIEVVALRRPNNEDTDESDELPSRRPELEDAASAQSG